MADHQDEIMGSIAHHIATIYGMLGMICAALPLPIALPQGIVTNTEVIPAVRRVAELAEEQPLPREQKSQLFTTAISLLSAMDLFSLLIEVDFHEVRALCTIANIANAEEAAQELMAWIADQEG